MGNSDNWKPWKVCKTAYFTLIFFINNVLKFDVIYMIVCTRREAKTDWIVKSMTARMIVNVDLLGEDK